MKKIHLQGFANRLNVSYKLSDNYDLGVYFDFEEESQEVIQDVIVKIYTSERKSTLKEAEEGFLKKILGDLSMTGQEYGYSEYTIEGFNVWDVTIGGHKLQQIVDSQGEKYIHITMEKAEVKK